MGELQVLKDKLLDLGIEKYYAEEIFQRVKDIPLSNKELIHDQITQVLRCYAGTSEIYKTIIQFKKENERRPFSLKNQIIPIKESSKVGSDFWIGPVKLKQPESVAFSNECKTYKWNVIFIEEDNVESFLGEFLYKNFDSALKENKNRCGGGDNFEHWGDNFFTFAKMRKIIAQIKKVIRMMESDFSNPKLDDHRKCWEDIIYKLPEYKDRFFTSQIEKYQATEKHKDKIIDFYKRFIWYMETFMKDSEKDGFNLMLFAGP